MYPMPFCVTFFPNSLRRVLKGYALACKHIKSCYVAQVRVCRLVCHQWRALATDVLLSDTAVSKCAAGGALLSMTACTKCHISSTRGTQATATAAANVKPQVRLCPALLSHSAARGGQHSAARQTQGACFASTTA